MRHLSLLLAIAPGYGEKDTLDMEFGEGRSQGQWPESEHLICTLNSIAETNSGFPGPSLDPCGILFSIEGGSL